MINKRWSGLVLFSLLAALVLFSSLDTMALLEEPSGMTDKNCRNCHNGNLSFNGTVAERHHALVESQGYVCEDCHVMIWDNTTQEFYPEVIRNCLVCHVNKDHSYVHLLVVQPGSYECLDCHPLVWDEANQRYNPEVIYDCTVCHGYAKNANPIIANPGGPYMSDEGSLITFDASGSSHPDGDFLRYRWDFTSDGIWDTPLSKNPTVNHTCNDDVTGNVTVEVRVGMNKATATAPLTVMNVPPVVEITSFSDGLIYPTGRPVTFTGTYFDPGTDTHDIQWTFESVTTSITGTDVPPNVEITSFSDGTGRSTGRTGMYLDPGKDTHTAEWKFESDIALIHSVSDGSVSTDYTFTDPGLYTVNLTVTDDNGGVGTADSGDGYIVIYNPSSGLVTGKGWVYSPPEACPTLCGNNSGKAQFSFTSNYKKGMAVPTGETQFKFQAGGLNFNSNGYEWMVVSGATVILKGNGTMNRAGVYRFMLTAIDADINTEDNYSVDRFRIKIWEEVGGEEIIAYDNTQSHEGEGATVEIGGGSVVIHNK